MGPFEMILDLPYSVHPPESYSRQLDQRVLGQEMPYGYTMEPPPADTGDFNQHRIESHKEYNPKRKK